MFLYTFYNNDNNNDDNTHTLDCFLSVSVTGKTDLTRLPDDVVVEGDCPPIVVWNLNRAVLLAEGPSE